MGRFRLCLMFLVAVAILFDREPVAARVQVVTVHGTGLEGNLLDYDPDRTVWVYLPEGYETQDRRYPVLYWLHPADGHGGVHSGLYRILDDLIDAGNIQPMIVVTPDAGLSFYGNSVVNGNWEDFVASELVDYIDHTFRTVPHPSARGVAGHSMGGGGAIRMAMSHPDRFSIVYGMSPGVIGVTSMEYADEVGKGGLAQGHARAFVPDPDNPPTYHEAIFETVEGEEQVNLKAWDRLIAATPLAMARDHVDNLSSLRAIRFDVGTGDGFRHIPSGCRALSAELTRLGIDHVFDEYDGDHSSSVSQRQRDIVLPFFSETLTIAHEPTFFPQLLALTPAVIVTTVEQALQLDLDLKVEANTWSQPPVLDLGPFGRDEQARLSGANGAYTVSLELEAPSNGHWDLPLWVEPADAARHVYRFLSVCAYPVSDLTIVDEGFAEGWVAAPKGGAAVPVASTVAAVRGETALALKVESASFVGWSVGLVPPEPLPGFGYISLDFWFHPGDATGRALNMGINNWATKLLADDGDAIEVDMAVAEWQHLSIPVSALGLGSRPIERIQFNGNVEGTFYIDDMRLVLDPSAPSVPTAVEEERAGGRPDGFVLAQNYPNPFNAETTVVFDLPTAQRIELAVYNLAAQRVATLARGPREAGSYSVRWDGRTDAGLELASGVYIYRLITGEVSSVRKLLLLR